MKVIIFNIKRWIFYFSFGLDSESIETVALWRHLFFPIPTSNEHLYRLGSVFYFRAYNTSKDYQTIIDKVFVFYSNVRNLWADNINLLCKSMQVFRFFVRFRYFFFSFYTFVACPSSLHFCICHSSMVFGTRSTICVMCIVRIICSFSLLDLWLEPYHTSIGRRKHFFFLFFICILSSDRLQQAFHVR